MEIKASQSKIWSLMGSFWTPKPTILSIQFIFHVLSKRKFLFVYNDEYRFSPDSIKTVERQHTEIWRPLFFALFRQNDANQHHTPISLSRARFKDRQRKKRRKHDLPLQLHLSLSLTYHLLLFTWKTLSHYCQKDSGMPSLWEGLCSFHRQLICCLIVMPHSAKSLPIMLWGKCINIQERVGDRNK